MATGEVDLKTLLEHDYKMVQAIAGTSRLLITELDASHYWLTQSVSLFKRLIKISANVATLLDTCEEHWSNKATAFSKPEVVKLWKTAAGLWSALPGEQKKFDDYVARKRRERIMGQVEEEAHELDEEEVASDKATYKLALEEIETTCAGMLERIADLPEALLPTAKTGDKPAIEEQVSSTDAENGFEEKATPDGPVSAQESPSD